MLMSLFFNSFCLKFSFFLLDELLILLFLIFQFIPEERYLLFELVDLSLEAVLLFKVNWQLVIKSLCEVFEGNIRDQFGVLKRQICDRSLVFCLKPLGYGLPFISVSISCDNRIIHSHFGNRACPLLLQTLDEIMVFTVAFTVHQ